MSPQQWIVLGLLLVTLAIELAVQPTTRGFFVRLFNTLNPIRLAGTTGATNG